MEKKKKFINGGFTFSFGDKKHEWNLFFLSMGLFQTFLQSISFYNMAAKAIYKY